MLFSPLGDSIFQPMDFTDPVINPNIISECSLDIISNRDFGNTIKKAATRAAPFQ